MGLVKDFQQTEYIKSNCSDVKSCFKGWHCDTGFLEAAKKQDRKYNNQINYLSK